MTPSFTLIADLAAQAEPPAGGILSRTIYQDDRIKVVVFGFDADQELSEHTASTPALVQILRGEATLTLGTETADAAPGTWVHMPANLPHAVHAHTPTVMLLVLLR